MIVDNKPQEKVSEPEKKELKEFELLDMEDIESSDVSVLYGGESVNLQTNNGEVLQVGQRAKKTILMKSFS